MNSAAALAFFAAIVLTSADGATIDPQDHGSTTPRIILDNEASRNAGRALETLGHFLQGKITGTNESQRKEIIEALTILVKPQPELEDRNNAYFFKAIKGIVRSITAEKVGSVVAG